NGAAILQAVERGLELPKDQWPRLERPKRYDRDPDYEDRLKRLKKTRDRLMEQWDLRPGVVCANQLLAEIARTRPSSLAELGAVEGLRQWQLRTFGKALLEAL
ncbi:MAG: HRDC domain-containing protein, partial [Flavobacteriales bacterium]|nr:HRDC domain-containing protein [Flavobacteriales bacterium]MCB0784646.1 HRDC domain-containing protein [Flavobacteriales bacterium]